MKKMIKILWRIAVTCLLFIGLSIPQVSGIAVMSVDLGSEWMKVAIVSPGVPMEIVLNKESKRKTPAVIAFRDNERLFGEDALNIGMRFPSSSYLYLLDLLGKKIDNPVVELYRKRFPYYNIEADSDRNTVVFRNGNQTFSVEELIAQLLQKARSFAEESLKQPITECVLIVPGFFGQSERMALQTAANLANLKVLQLINDYAAVALNYGLFRSNEINETAQYFVFYDMGAYKTSAAVVSYQLVKDKTTRETNPVIQVVGVGYDRTLGGLEMQLRLRDYLGREFNNMKKTKTDVFSNPRAMAKLFKEAGRVKNVLSANANHFAQIEGLLDDKDFKFQVTRDKYLELIADLIERVPGPLNRALSASGLTMDVINQVILFGGGTRVPKIQEVLKNAIGQELSKNINMDEAAALGAVYKAADLANGFRVKKFIVKDAVLFPIQITFDREGDSGQIRAVRRTLFSAMNSYPQKKMITFSKHTDDFNFNVNYAELEHLSAEEVLNIGSQNLTQISLTGVAKVLKENTGDNMESKGIKAHFILNDSGLFELSGVDLVVEKTVKDEPEESTLSKLGQTISKLFSGVEEDKKEETHEKDEKEEEVGEKEKEKEKDKTKNQSKENVDDDDKKGKDKTKTKQKEKSKGDKDKGSDEKAAKSDATIDEPAATNKTEKKPKVVVVKETIPSSVHLMFTVPLEGDKFKAAKKKLEDLNDLERETARRQTALNALESFVIEANQRIDETEYSSCATEKEIDNIRAACAKISDWLYEDGEHADAGTYEQKLIELKKLTADTYARHWEHTERPEALSTLQKLIGSAELFLENAKNMTKEVDPDKDVFTTVELETLAKAIQDAYDWQKKEVEAQAKLKRNEPVRLTIKSVAERLGLLDREVKYLINKMKIWRPKVKEVPKKVDKNETIASDDNGDDAKLMGENNTDEPTGQEKLDFPELMDTIEDVLLNATDAKVQNEKNITEKTEKHTEL